MVQAKKLITFFVFSLKIKTYALTMQEITRDKLIPGKEYYLQSVEEEYSPPIKTYKMIAKFERLKPSLIVGFQWACFSNFRKIEQRSDPSYYRYVELNHHWRFYEIGTNKTQRKMENRSYNMILLDIINPNEFT
jgi:hypothetical protein